MTSHRKVERNIARILSGKPSKTINQPGRLLDHMSHELGRSVDRPTIAAALDSMSEKGSLMLEKSGNVYNRAIYVGGSVDKSDRSPQSKRERMFAKNVPSTLRDDQCGPVTIRKIEPAVSKVTDGNLVVEPAPATAGSTPRRTYLSVVDLNLALIALREAANEDGVIELLSCSAIIQRSLECSNASAERLNNFLFNLGLRKTVLLGRGKNRSFVDMHVDEISDEHFRMARKGISLVRGEKSQEPPKPDVAESNPEPVSVTEPSSDERSSEQSTLDMNPDAVAVRLTEIIHDLERQQAQDRARIESLVQELTGLQTQNDQLKATNAELKDQITQPVLTVSQPVMDILARHSLRSVS